MEKRDLTMVVNELVYTEVGLERIQEPFQIIENLASGKNVLNIGAAGGIFGYLPDKKDVWLHQRLMSLANKVVGVDIDAEGIEYGISHGYTILNENCETMNLGERFDLIVMSDVIEHVNAPVTAINNLMEHLNDNGVLVITTPNGTPANVFVRSLLRKQINVFYDHVAVYYPEHFQVICNRLGFKLDAVYLFDHISKGSFGLRFKSFLFQIFTLIAPRLASSMMVIIRKNDGNK